MKTCNKCGKTKDLSLFNKNKSKKDGFHEWCKECRKKESKKYRDKYFPTRAIRKYNSPIETENKTKARRILNHAIRDGKVIKENCKKCGSPAEAHHPDYNKPLEVDWYCKKHHTEAHTK